MLVEPTDKLVAEERGYVPQRVKNAELLRINRIKRPGESFNDVLKRLLDFFETTQALRAEAESVLASLHDAEKGQSGG